VAVLLGLVLPAVLVAGVVAAGGCGAVRWSGLCVVDLEVHGTARVPADAVRAAAAPAVGRPLVDVDAGAVAAAVRRVPGVRDATVRASWPGTLRVEVRERTVLAAVPGRGGVRLVDADGVHLGTAPRRPAGVPLVRVDVERAGAGALLAAVRVARGLPAELRPLVREVGAATRDGVWLGLRDGSRVVWGSEEEAALKVAVLAPLRRGAPGGRGVVYDVSAPWAPAVSGAR
jgi:cell division protein FtsQ